MWIKPNVNIAINGRHAPAGIPIETDDQTGKALISDRRAVESSSEKAAAEKKAGSK